MSTARRHAAAPRNVKGHEFLTTGGQQRNTAYDARNRSSGTQNGSYSARSAEAAGWPVNRAKLVPFWTEEVTRLNTELRTLLGSVADRAEDSDAA